jgi:hypothetical protein
LSKKNEEIFDQRLGPSGGQLDYDLFLYDVTSTYFEGEGKLNRLAQGKVTQGIIVGIASKSVLAWWSLAMGFPWAMRSLRGKRKVDIQWLLYCTVYNLLKVHRYGPGLA